jgi:hypothetical protein
MDHDRSAWLLDPIIPRPNALPRLAREDYEFGGLEPAHASWVVPDARFEADDILTEWPARGYDGSS